MSTKTRLHKLEVQLSAKKLITKALNWQILDIIMPLTEMEAYRASGDVSLLPEDAQRQICEIKRAGCNPVIVTRAQEWLKSNSIN